MEVEVQLQEMLLVAQLNQLNQETQAHTDLETQVVRVHLTHLVVNLLQVVAVVQVQLDKQEVLTLQVKVV